MSGIFINYRRDDAPGVAGRLYDHLARHFPRGELFIDVDAMKPGLDFVQQLDAQVSRCDVLLAIIGPHWLTAKNDQGRRRLDESKDYVRIELASALKRDIPVIPVLVEGASMPSEDNLPEDLKSLARRHALELRHTRFAADAEDIVAALKTTLPRQGRSWVRMSLAAAAIVGIVALGVSLYQSMGRHPVIQSAEDPVAVTKQGADPQEDPAARMVTERAFTSFEQNIDRPGGDYTSHRLSEADAILCQKLCADDQRCLAWTYVAPGYQEANAVCWLKNTIPEGARKDVCCTSGVAYYRRPQN